MRKSYTIPLLLLCCLALSITWALTRPVQKPAPQKPAPQKAEWTPASADPWAECTRILDAERMLMPLHIAGRVQLVDDKTGRVLETQPFRWDCRDTVSCRYTVGPMEQIREPSLEAIVDHDERVIRIVRGPTGAPQGDVFRLLQWRASLAHNRDSVQVQENTRGDRRINAPGLQLVYRASDYTLESVSLYDVEPGGEDTTGYHLNRLEFRYDTLTRVVTGFSEHFYTPYLTLAGGKPRLQPAYADYRMVGLLTPTP